jgi:alpha-tubulin suppressor-like RCC1 family protein
MKNLFIPLAVLILTYSVIALSCLTSPPLTQGLRTSPADQQIVTPATITSSSPTIPNESQPPVSDKTTKTSSTRLNPATAVSGYLYSWGWNLDDTFADNSTGTYNRIPFPVGGLSGITAIASGGHSLALKSDGTVWAWGYNNESELGNGTSRDSNTPVQVSVLTNGLAIAAGGSNSLAITNRPIDHN